ncbi:Serine aminopeptidase, S33, partial [Dillenia turbinata]
MDSFAGSINLNTSISAYQHLAAALSLIPISHYLLGICLLFLTFLYFFWEVHFVPDLFTGFRGDPVVLTFDPSSQVYEEVVSKCKLLHGRFHPTPWLSSPHFQTSFMSFIGNSPPFSYTREIFHASDGGTLALDWLMSSDVGGNVLHMNQTINNEDKTPLVVVVPGLTSDSEAPYIKHLVFKIAKRGWNVVVINHRGLGGISITSDCFYTGGWTEDIRSVIKYLHGRFPKAPLFAVGTSIGANVLVKYLGEEGADLPLVGAAAVGSPWDLV